MPQPSELSGPAHVHQGPCAPGVGHDRHRLRVTEHVRRLRGGERWVDRPEHSPGLEDRPPGLEELEAVGEHHRHDVAGLDAQIS